ncbi:MAG: TlyA family rRNA (cytidine-2'-O)-methyltransferase [Nitrospinae bacterium CG11_big_fil_rev_8_21_14_0_20_45_15]|nr:MAG: TlyA family rRNA (cytidine-2'-O)-methyltransferase [Nitrospinae bacterium CG11_big_fil_rev_8_21_14_0_20_45_15]
MTRKPEKLRLDQLLVQLNIVPSREQAQGLILAGKIRVDGIPIDKPGKLISPESLVESTGELHPYVSRGGLKLELALKEFAVSAQDKIAIDIGASTGGFTDCLLQNGAVKVYAVDVGYGQLAWKLQTDERVHRLDRVNARNLTIEDIGESVELAVIDVSFISLTHILPAAWRVLKEGGDCIALVKPQFEVGKDQMENKGIIKDPKKHQQVLETLMDFAKSQHHAIYGLTTSPIHGQKGNKEFLMHFAEPGKEGELGSEAIQTVLNDSNN